MYFLAWEIVLVLTRGQQGPDYRNKKDPAAGARWKSRDKKRGKKKKKKKKARKELEHTPRRMWFP